MTCIVAIADGHGTVWMAGDRAAVEDSHYLQLAGAPKVFVNGDYLIGYTSSFRMGQLLQYCHVLPGVPDDCDVDGFMATDFVEAVRKLLKDGGYAKVENGREMCGVFLVGVKGRLYVFDEDFHVQRPHHGFGACGSGISCALGSLLTSADDPSCQRRLLKALEAAETFTTTVRRPFDVMAHGDRAEAD